jgi:ABC-2 type transport system permease protein
MLDLRVIKTLARRTLSQFVESPVAYVVGFFFYLFVGIFFGKDFFVFGQASVEGITRYSPWALWFVVPALTMGIISEELRSGTFEQLSTLPVRDAEIVLGKYLGFAVFALVLVSGLIFFPIVVRFVSGAPQGLDGGATIGMLVSLYFLALAYGAMGFFASTLSRNQVVAFIIGMIFCTLFFFLGQTIEALPPKLAKLADSIGVLSHLETMGRGVFDLRDLVYFLSLIGLFLTMAVARLNSRRF